MRNTSYKTTFNRTIAENARERELFKITAKDCRIKFTRTGEKVRVEITIGNTGKGHVFDLRGRIYLEQKKGSYKLNDRSLENHVPVLLKNGVHTLSRQRNSSYISVCHKRSHGAWQIKTDAHFNRQSPKRFLARSFPQDWRPSALSGDATKLWLRENCDDIWFKTHSKNNRETSITPGSLVETISTILDRCPNPIEVIPLRDFLWANTPALSKQVNPSPTYYNTIGLDDLAPTELLRAEQASWDEHDPTENSYAKKNLVIFFTELIAKHHPPKQAATITAQHFGIKDKTRKEQIRKLYEYLLTSSDYLERFFTASFGSIPKPQAINRALELFNISRDAKNSRLIKEFGKRYDLLARNKQNVLPPRFS